jgi:hypothetical protein
VSNPAVVLPGAPPGGVGAACTVPNLFYANLSTGVLASCPSGTLIWTAFGTGGGGLTSPLTTKGDMWVWSTTNARLPLGTQGQVLTVDTGQATGLAWADLAGQLHSIPIVIDGGGSVISTGDAGVYPTSAFACTINRVDFSADQSGSVTIEVWKRAGAIPTSGNKISASAPLTLSSAQISQNGVYFRVDYISIRGGCLWI